jgi:DNA-binding transcriptional MerR regulator/methylmalonyl-CoA mutase cobalamin-binding subunit
MKTPKYPIRAVAKLTGLSVDTLRAWERRYAAVRPERDGRGRLYSEGDIRRLSLLRDAVERGHAIGQVAAMDEADLERIAGAEPEIPPPPVERVRSVDLAPLFAAVERYDGGTLDRELGRYAALLGSRDLVHQVVHPLLTWIGERWAEGKLTIAQEHLASTALRHLLGTLVRLYAPSRPARTLLFATPAGERHEFGILSAAMLAAGGGLGTVYLGVDLPAAEIVRAARATAVDAVVLGVVVPSKEAHTFESVGEVRSALGPGVELWAGGCGAPECGATLARLDVLYLESFLHLERELLRLGARL